MHSLLWTQAAHIEQPAEFIAHWQLWQWKVKSNSLRQNCGNRLVTYRGTQRQPLCSAHVGLAVLLMHPDEEPACPETVRDKYAARKPPNRCVLPSISFFSC